MYQHTSEAPVMSMSLPIKKLKLPWDCKAPFSSYPALVIAGWLFWKLNGTLTQSLQGWHHPMC